MTRTHGRSGFLAAGFVAAGLLSPAVTGCTHGIAGEPVAGPNAAMISGDILSQTAYTDIATKLGENWGLSFSVICDDGLPRFTGASTVCTVDPVVGRKVRIKVTVYDVRGSDGAFRLEYGLP